MISTSIKKAHNNMADMRNAGEKDRGNSGSRRFGKLSGRAGMTMAETLITIAIIVILAGVAFIAVWVYQRSLAQTERDGVAKEIFIAAQNHLTMARGEGYLGITEDVDKLTGDLSDDQRTQYEKVYGRSGNWGDEKGVRYFIVNGKVGSGNEDGSGNAVSDFTDDNSSILDLMLPFGSVDETVRLGGSYIIRYQPKSGTVLDVFYCTPSGSPERFNHTLTTAEYPSLAGKVDKVTENNTTEDHKSDRRTYSEDNSVLGWYGGDKAKKLPTIRLEEPLLDLVNGDTLYAEVKNNETNPNASTELKLIITGITSGAKAAVKLTSDDDRCSTINREIGDKTETYYICTLDDITRQGMHFADLEGQTPLGKNAVQFIPGEDIKVQAVAYSNKALANIAYSGADTENSLFESIADFSTAYSERKHAYIGSIRHLENLSYAISNKGKNGIAGKTITIEDAFQTRDLDWDTFRNTADYSLNGKGHGTGNQGKVCDMQNNSADAYYPVDLTDETFDSPFETYDGLRHSIKNVETVQAKNVNAGLFGKAYCKIKNLELIDFDIKGSGNVGALAGVSGGTVLNVIAYNTDEKEYDDNETPEATPTVVSNGGAAGGLIGSMTGGTVKYCGAALVVSGGTKAGGLIGEAKPTEETGGSSNSTIVVEASYSGGHTIKGEYYKHTYDTETDSYTDKRVTEKDNDTKKDIPVGLYNVSAGSNGTAGGLIGSAVNTEIKNCYSTCSVEGKAADSGGFAGAVSGSTKIEHSYCTGLVSGGWIKDDTGYNLVNNAFIGSGTNDVNYSDCYFYEIINEFANRDDAGVSYKSSEIVDVKPLDKSFEFGKEEAQTATREVYNDFVGASNTWNPAVPYDSTLRKYYKESSDKYLFNLKTVTQLESEDSAKSPVDKSGDPTNKGSLFVNTHYGDWPAPEVFIINTNN